MTCPKLHKWQSGIQIKLIPQPTFFTSEGTAAKVSERYTVQFWRETNGILNIRLNYQMLYTRVRKVTPVFFLDIFKMQLLHCNIINVPIFNSRNSNLQGLNKPQNPAQNGRKRNLYGRKTIFQESGVKSSNSGSVPDLQCNFVKTQGSLGFYFITCKLRVFKAENLRR